MEQYLRKCYLQIRPSLPNNLNLNKEYINKYSPVAQKKSARNRRIISTDSLRPSTNPIKRYEKLNNMKTIETVNPPDHKRNLNEIESPINMNKQISNKENKKLENDNYQCSPFKFEATREQSSFQPFSMFSFKNNHSQKEEKLVVKQKQLNNYNKRITMETESIPIQPNKNALNYSYSFDQSIQSQYQHQKQLFTRFLRSNQLQWIQIYSSMRHTGTEEQQLINIVKLGQNQLAIRQNKILAHYIGIWIDSMGYRDSENKQRILDNVQLMFNDHPATRNIAEYFYDSLFQSYLPTELQIQALLEVCKRGWEYFSFLCCRLIKILLKQKNFKNFGPQFYKELKGAIKNPHNI